ncbi:hypothetical protein NLU13_5370 [Sarocladium strictum]|uniref:Zn(2)-C6 fungal-type domain-containing protein n=1 Tax=Sarocladium strictum TaxID=5046 RepID=A0AA39GJ81_SARSR|nr:hypothetical protein NLU13_5370 [Sarocladium strictum]
MPTEKSSPRSSRGRVRTGCLTCRSRKVKCDEGQPACRNCTRLERHCVYQPRRTPWSRRETAASPSTDSSSSRAVRGRTKATDRTAWTARHPGESTVQILHTSPPSPASRTGHTIQSPPLSELRIFGQSPHQDPFEHPDRLIVNVTARLEKALEDRRRHQQPGSLSPDDPTPDAVEDGDVDEPSSLISRDIELTTTMDLLASCGETSQVKSMFIELVECPGITPFDTVNWDLAKQHMVHANESCSTVSAGIAALATLFKGQAYSMPLSRATALHRVTQTSFEELLSDHTRDLGHCLMVVFLICLFDLVHRGETAPFFKAPSKLFLDRLAAWAEHPKTHSELSRRLVTWLRILQVVTMRGGGTGLLAESVVAVLPWYEGPLQGLAPPDDQQPDISTHFYEVISAPVFDFYYRLQLLSGEMARLTHYHRSRTTGADQQEVVKLVSHIKSRLLALWGTRPAVQRQTPQELREQLAPKLAKQIIGLVNICHAAYHAEFVEIDRLLGDPVSKFTDSREALREIRDIVDEECDSEGTELNPGYLRALFLYAIECMDREQNRWAVQRISQIQTPIYRSKFFAAFGKELADAQIRKERRVTSMYFCLWYFRMPPPYI